MGRWLWVGFGSLTTKMGASRCQVMGISSKVWCEERCEKRTLGSCYLSLFLTTVAQKSKAITRIPASRHHANRHLASHTNPNRHRPSIVHQRCRLTSPPLRIDLFPHTTHTGGMDRISTDLGDRTRTLASHSTACVAPALLHATLPPVAACLWLLSCGVWRRRNFTHLVSLMPPTTGSWHSIR